MGRSGVESRVGVRSKSQLFNAVANGACEKKNKHVSAECHISTNSQENIFDQNVSSQPISASR